MAELPDLTVFARILNRKFAGLTINFIEVTVSKKINISAEKLTTALEGKDLINVTREGKTLQFHFSGNQVLGLHLMLRGELVQIENGESPKFQIASFHFKNNSGFAVVDLQKQATLTFQPSLITVPDALALDKEYFMALVAKKRTVIKTLLMDQHLMRGIGNSYADEILYHAGVSPFSTANAIPDKAVHRLYQSIGAVLNKAIVDIDQANADELQGELKDFMHVHNPALGKTKKGELIKTDKIGGRKTYYTDSQELFIA